MTAGERAALVGAAGKNLGAALGVGELLVQWPTPGQLFTIEEAMVEIAQREYCVSPLEYVHAIPEAKLGGADRLQALSLALSEGAGGGLAPSALAVNRAYNSAAGLAHRLWVLTRRTHPEITRDQLRGMVTEENRPAVIDALNQMLRALDPKSAPPATGA